MPSLLLLLCVLLHSSFGCVPGGGCRSDEMLLFLPVLGVGGCLNAPNGVCLPSGASGNESIVFFDDDSACGENFIAMGSFTTFFATSAIAMGYYTFAYGFASTAMGAGTTTTNGTDSIDYLTAIGRCNSPQPNDIFEIGGGDHSVASGCTSRTNIFSIDTSGHVFIGFPSSFL